MADYESTINLGNNPLDSKSIYFDFLTQRYLRHRYIAMGLLLFFALFVIASINNRLTLTLVLKPDTGLINCYQGALFPFGREKVDEFAIGLEPGWETLISDTSIRDHLLSGINLRDPKQIDPILTRVLIQLGQHALNQPTIEKQREALYYLQKVEALGNTEDLRKELAAAYFNLAALTFETQGDVLNARRYLSISQSKIPDYPGSQELADLLDSTRTN